MKLAFMNDIVNDQFLATEIHRKNKQVFETVYKKYYQYLYATARHYVNDRENAEEIVHDVFIRIWQKPDVIQLESSLKAYLFRSVVNASLSFHRKAKANQEKLEAYQTMELNSTNVPIDEEAMDTIHIQLAQAIDALPPQCKKVLLLSRFEKLKQQQIADQLGISIKTVKNHLTYGFNKMRTSIYLK